jgi:ABC-type nickel/cobalt efflux system permease component RcnA
LNGTPITATLLLGLLLGLRHALDADHVAAVAAMIGERDGLRRALRTGLSWGAGHAAALGVAGAVLLVGRRTVPTGVAAALEAAVGVMLIVLGTAALVAALQSRVHAHAHEHDGAVHIHLHAHARTLPHEAGARHRHPHPLRPALRPFLVGSLHGLAGTGALVLLVLATLPTLMLGLLYLGIFGAGSIAGMAIMSVVLGAPLLVARRRAARLHLLLRGAAGAGSLALGAWTFFEAGVATGLFG